MGFMNTGFLSMTHRRRFCEIWNRFPCKSPKFISAIFLLTSSEDIWLRSKDCITANGKLDISRFSIRGISTTSYTLYMAARDLYFETDMVSILYTPEREPNVHGDRAAGCQRSSRRLPAIEPHSAAQTAAAPKISDI